MSGKARSSTGVGPVLAAACLLFLASCAARPGLYPVSGSALGGLPGKDDLAFQLLSGAVDESLRYYGRLPDDRLFRYGDDLYSAREMEASLRLFRATVEQCAPARCEEEIRRKFRFFESRNESGKAFFTGYYEPIIPGSLHPRKGYEAPLYGVPDDLIVVDLDPWTEAGMLPEGLDNRILRGRLDGRRVVPYDDRKSIYYERSLEGRAEVLAYVRDHVDLAFLQIQGSGLLRLEDGRLLRVNYAGQNGHPYRAVGRVLLDRIPREKMSLQSIRSYLRAHPGEVPDILNYNPSYTFFRLVEEGPLGSIGRPLTAGRSVAMDRRAGPPGGIVYFRTFYLPEGSREDPPTEVGRFGLVQDTGGAIRGHGRADIFWGSGADGEKIAGPMRNEGQLYLVVARKEYLRPAAGLRGP
jgi:membrane-bound lytic murein transglycosylase A